MMVKSWLQRQMPLLSGPAAFVLGYVICAPQLGAKGAAAMGMALWMALWWVLRPVDIAVTSMLPIVINSLFDLIPASHVISQYFSEIVVLLLGADLLCLTWHTTGLDRRISVRVLCHIGASMRAQVFAWLMVSVVLSVFLPNVVVAAILCPIAVAMLDFLGGGTTDCRMAMPILLAIGWGSGIGGFGTVLAFVVFASCMSEVSSNTAAVSIVLPIVISICTALGLDAASYILIVIVAANCAYVLPVSTRAIPVGFGLEAGTQIRLGLRLTVLNMLVTTAVGCACLRFVPWFGQL